MNGNIPALGSGGFTLATKYEQLQRAFRELQLELEETNRGVVALFAELDGQAERLRQAGRTCAGAPTTSPPPTAPKRISSPRCRTSCARL